MAYHSATVYFKNDDGKIPGGVTEVLEKYGAKIEGQPGKVDEGYAFTVDLGKSTGLEAMEFMKECGKVEGIDTVVGGSYKPSLAQRVKDLFKK